MTAGLRNDIAFQRYQFNSTGVIAAYALSENRFTILEDDAAFLVGQLLDGADPRSILYDIKTQQGPDALSQVETFFDSVLPLFFGTPLNDVGAGRRSSSSLQTSSLEEEDLFFLRCSEFRTFCSLACELSYTCNLRCNHCYNPHHESRDQVGTEEWLDLLDQGREMGLLRLCLTGGEVGIHPGFWRILEKARRLHLAIDVLTNGQLFADRGLASRLASLFPRSVQCSLYAASSGIHDSITGVQGSWTNTIKCLEHFADMGIPIAVKCPAMQSNYREIPGVANIAAHLGAQLQVDVNITARNNGDPTPTELRLNEQQLTWLFNEPHLPLYQGLERLTSESPQERKQDDEVCGAGSNGLAVQPDGTIKPCLSFMRPLGNLRHHALSEIWAGETLALWRGLKTSDRVGCNSCQMHSMCSFCPGIAENDVGQCLRPNPNDCRVASVRTAVQQQILRRSELARY